MNYILKLSFFVYIIAKLTTTSSVEYMEVVVLLLTAASSIYREKFGSNWMLYILEGAIIYYGVHMNDIFSFLYGLMVYDLISSRYYLGVVSVILAGLSALSIQMWIDFAFITSLCCSFAYMKNVLQTKEELYRGSFDKQRQYSYQLEQAKARLISSTEEAAHLAEVKERNRIARQIHDSVGHNIAGILMQLQAANKLFEKDVPKAMTLLDNSIIALSDTLTIMRDTVHNIKPTEKLGVEYLTSVINNFGYCTVDFNVIGDLGELPANIMQLCHYNIKEALTNIGKYSQATRAEIKIDVNEQFVRLYIKDNGVGCSNFKEGLGISGMKERVQNAGGTISISTDKGFMIVSLIPIKSSMEVVI